MRLFYSPTSPYARKVRVVARELNVQLEETPINPFASDTDFGAVNPINRVPALELDDGRVLFDSPVICEYLDVEGGSALLPREGASRWAVLRLQALGDGLMDAATPLRQETARPLQRQSPDRIALHRRTISQVLDHLDQDVSQVSGVSIGTISIASALSYLDFRFPADGWDEGRQRLHHWYEDFRQRPSFQQTALG
ncbi:MULTISPECIES: glutathione S-transferase N-terminal domain-containing protein [unclassified Shinella]|uniref:glutathione S-transferase N-terminal domain-containing protein n=1 Tax=unclassified Shinella TaxID=2643062 RepID=UPI00225CDB22|nr:glutathione S-transferase N-terminal domain-containing protein [Shinella sp. YE25]MDC7259464.1 glutathione S-transferase N-terminal domain-containing protein [Shinella sp. YE25]CAI0341219.1 Glutathione S-transferase family protein [Rhizobiaceae bacterium]CAK7260862.1 glutathione S-transferase [Shinella sp. WSC3-e]